MKGLERENRDKTGTPVSLYLALPMQNRKWVILFFAVMACSWMPHWACHYYRLETNSSFAVGSWEFSRTDSYLSLFVYSVLICLCLVSIVNVKTRYATALSSGILHSVIGLLHVVRLLNPFRFVVFGYDWPLSASLREVFIVLTFGIACLVVAVVVRRRG
jgi:hypothetical protein